MSRSCRYVVRHQLDGRRAGNHAEHVVGNVIVRTRMNYNISLLAAAVAAMTIVCGGGEGEGRSSVVDRASVAVFGGGVTRTDGTLGRRGRAPIHRTPLRR
jgi:hypothetical protein